MKKVTLLVALIILVAFASSGVMGQQKPAPAKPAATQAPAPAKPTATPAPAPAKAEKFSGMIDKVDEMAKTIVVKGKVKKEEKTLTFATDGNTKIQKAGKDMPFADLKKDMTVSVEYKKEGEKMIATMIKVAAPKAAPRKEKAAEAPKK
jgi:glucose/arabinose dehydrogenase